MQAYTQIASIILCFFIVGSICAFIHIVSSSK